MFRFLRSFLLVALLVHCSCSSTANEKRAQMRLNLDNSPESLDPARVRSLNGINIAVMLFEGLTRLDSQDEPLLAIASSCEVSEDQTLYTFTLKETFWSNGEPLVADDFVYAWQRILDPGFPSATGNALYCLKNAQQIKEGKIGKEFLGVKALDSKTLQVELQRPCAYFLKLLANPPFFPVSQKVVSKHSSWATKASSFVSNGPFILREWKQESQITLLKNPHYWDAQEVQLQQVELLSLAANTELSLYQSGELDWAGSPLSFLPQESLAVLRQSKELNMRPYNGVRYLRMNVKSPGVASLAVRRQLSEAIDRKVIATQVFQGGQKETKCFVPKSLALTTRAPEGEKKGVLKDFPELSLLYVIDDQNQLLAQELQEQWRKNLGVTVRLEAVEMKLFFSRVSQGDYQMALSSYIADVCDPIDFLEAMKGNLSNSTRWENREYKSFLEAAEREREPQSRLALLSQAEELLLQESPIIPLYEMSMVFLRRPNLKGVSLSASGRIDLKRAYFSSEDKQ